METQKIIEKIQAAARSSTTETRFIRTMDKGEIAHQGDVYLVRINDCVDRGVETSNHQLAPGTTKGSRHVVVGDVQVFESIERNELLGPIVVARSRFRLTHPEHAEHSLPSGTYQVGYQLDYQTRSRVQD